MTAEVPGFEPHVLREYAVLADGYRGALIGPRGDVSWLCAPRWDSPAVFSQLVGGRGAYAISPRDRYVWGGYYEPGTLIWRSRWVTTGGDLIESREALRFPADEHRLVLLRRVVAARGPARVDILLDLAADFGANPVAHCRRDDDGRWLIDSGDLRARLTGAADAVPDSAGALRLRLDVPEGEHHDLVLEISDHDLPRPEDPEAAWAATERGWAAAVPAFAGSAAPRDSRHAYAVLTGLTAPAGGMVAAATLGLPERADAGRNYDYRYVWLRDQAYAGLATSVGEPYHLSDLARQFSTARVLADGDRLSPAYTLSGELPPAESAPDALAGYPGGRAVVGNWVRGQFQLDEPGELLQLYASAGRHDRLTSDDVRAAQVLIEVIGKRWDQPDAGIWELDDAWWTQSRLSAVAGLRTVASQLDPATARRAEVLADAIMAETSRRCLGPGDVWQRSPDHPGVDASLLLPPVRGALSPRDPRSLATLEAIERDLVQDGYVYRYRADGRPLGEAEGAFVMCGFALSLAQLEAGNQLEAYRWFERQRAACGSPGLLSEEFDVRQRQLRGNLPQAFVHALLLECSQRLGQVDPPVSTAA